MLNKSYIFCIILTVCFFNKVNGQFITLLQGNTPNYFGNILNPTNLDSFKVVNYRREIKNNTKYISNQLLTINSHGTIVDSINFMRGYSPLALPIKINNYYLWAFDYEDTVINGI